MAESLAPFSIRDAEPRDVPELMRLKRILAESEGSLHAVQADASAWLRDGFGSNPGFTAFVAEVQIAGSAGAPAIVGMATCSRRKITGWNGWAVFLQDLVVEPSHRHIGIARALTARVAAFAAALGSPIVELTVRADNPAQQFYLRTGFQHLPQCLTYVLAGPELAALAQSGSGTAPQPAVSPAAVARS